MEFFFVDPVGSSVDDLGGAFFGKPSGFAGREVFHVEVAIANVAYAFCIRRKFSKHQSRLGLLSPDLAKLARFSVDQPVVASCMVPPDFSGVRENQS